MARLTGALFSLAASGTIADTLTFAKWKGIQYVRTRVIPANPNTANQQEVRGVFSTLNEMWKRMPIWAREPFNLSVRGIGMTNRNRHIQLNVPALQGDANLDDLVMSVATGQAVAPATMTPSDAGGQVLNVVLTAPTVPTGYTITAMRTVAVLDGDPSPVLVRTTFAGQDVTDPYSIDLSVGVAGTYQVGGWACYSRDSDSRLFQSEALRATQVIA